MVGLATRAVKAGGSFGGYTHTLADEYQDCSPQQVAMISALASRAESAIVVGDPLQAIYGWMGARYTRFTVPGQQVERLTMDYSHRLPAAVAAFACSLMGKPPDSIRTGANGTTPLLHESDSHVLQARQISAQIIALVAAGTDPSSIAVLARQKRHLRAVHSGLLSHVPCRLSELDDDEEEDARHSPLDVAWLLARTRTAEACRSLTTKQLRARLADWARDNVNWKQVLAVLRANRSPRLAGRLIQISKIYLHLRGGQAQHKHLRNRLNLWSALTHNLRSVAKLRSMLKVQAVPRSTAAVTLASIHAAKGGQWDHVFVLGVSDGVLPDYRSATGHALEEERQLLYVAATRARRTLQLYHAPHLLLSGRVAERRSRFLRRALAAKTLALR